jgi:hypothetical protein
LVISSSVLAAPGYTIENPTFDAAYFHGGTPISVFYFDVVTTGFDAPILSPGVGAGAILGGDLTGITASNALNQYLPETSYYPGLGAIGDAAWAWDAFAFESSNSAVVSTVDGELVTFQLVQANPTGTPVDNDMIVARFFYEWDGTGGTDPSRLDITVQGPNPGQENPYLLTVDGDAVDLPLIPEPATMGLLGLGLIGLAVRRKR